MRPRSNAIRGNSSVESVKSKNRRTCSLPPDYLPFTCSSIFDHAAPRYAPRKSYIPFTHIHRGAPRNENETRSRLRSEHVHSNGNRRRQPYSRGLDKIQKQKMDHHLNKRIPLKTRLSKNLPSFSQVAAALRGGPRFSQ